MEMVDYDSDTERNDYFDNKSSQSTRSGSAKTSSNKSNYLDKLRMKPFHGATLVPFFASVNTNNLNKIVNSGARSGSHRPVNTMGSVLKSQEKYTDTHLLELPYVNITSASQH